MTTNSVTRADVIDIARSWIGTPYHHQASVKGIGADCLGLVRGVWREVYGREPEPPPAYSADWAEAGGRETLLLAAAKHALRLPIDARRPGDILIFRLRAGLPAKHAGILTDAAKFVHAAQSGPATEVALVPWWRRRIAGVFCFPDLSD